MKIIELIKVLNTIEDKEKEIFISPNNKENEFKGVCKIKPIVLFPLSNKLVTNGEKIDGYVICSFE